MARQEGASRTPTLPPLASIREFVRLQSEAPGQNPIAAMFGFDPVARSAAAEYSGALAEVTVVDALDALTGQWLVLDNVPLGDNEHPVAHILIGPPGVFTVALRNHAQESVWVGERAFVAGKNSLAGQTKFPHVRDVEHEAELVAERMSASAGKPVTVTACLVVAGATDLTVNSHPRHVEVLEPAGFAAWLADLPRLLSPQAVEQLRTAALAPGTWPGRPLAVDLDALSDRAAFDEIQRRVVAARRRRLFWAILGATLSQVTAVAAVTGVFGSSTSIL